jgi:hypothetical protein
MLQATGRIGVTAVDAMWLQTPGVRGVLGRGYKYATRLDGHARWPALRCLHGRAYAG